MVALETVESSNEQIKSSLPAGLVAVFVGGTNGVGETTLKQFAKHTVQPRVYIIGRSQEAGDRIKAECETLNPNGAFVFLKRDTSLIRNVDEICNDLISKEDNINLLFLTIGTLQDGVKTEEGLHYSCAITVHARNRFISNLLQVIRKAKALRRVVTVFSAGYEGRINMDDFQAWNLGRMAQRAHIASITTLALEAHHKKAPEVSFVHNFPGAVESGIGRNATGWLMRTIKPMFEFLGPLVNTPLVEAGDRHLFLGTSARFSAGSEDISVGVPLIDGLTLARGTDGQIGSGVYSVDSKGETAGPKVEELLAQLRSQGMVEQVWENIESDIKGALAYDKKSSTT